MAVTEGLQSAPAFGLSTPSWFTRVSQKSAWQLQVIGFISADLLSFAVATTVAAATLCLRNGVSARALIDVGIRDVAAPDWAWHGWSVVAVLLVALLRLAGRGHYTQRTPYWTAARDVIGTSILAAVGDLMLTAQVYKVPFTAEPVLRWLLFGLLVLTFRTLLSAGLSRIGLWNMRTLLIGPERDTERVAAALRSEPELGYVVVGALTRPMTGVVEGLGSFEMLVAARNARHVTIVADPGDPEGDARMVAALRRLGISHSWVPVVSTLPVRTARTHYFMSHDVIMMAGESPLARPVKRAVKRSFDLIATAVLLVVLSAMFLAIAGLIRRGGGPALYRHMRVGIDGRMFGCLKFRSMSVDADRILADLLASDPAAAAEWTATQKLRDDPRVTPIGKLLRKTSLDELPQLLNVIKGEMSLVGPRPVVPSELAFYGEDADYYTQARPGVTGLWQVSGRSDTSYDRRVQLDVWYVRNWSFWHDLAILVKTIPVVLLRRGAV